MTHIVPARPTLRLITTFALFLTLGISSSVTAEPAVDFNFDIRPLLSDRCYVCHGPDEESRQADLRLDLASGLQQEATGDAPRVITPGKADQSELWLRIASDDPDMVMPPSDSNLSLTDSEKSLIRKWIEQGAEHKEHWSFLPFEKSKSFSSATEAIDHYVAARQQAAGVTYREEAGRSHFFVAFALTSPGCRPRQESCKNS